MAKLENPVQMAVIGAPHGIKGELRVKTFTGDPEALGDYGPLYTQDGRAFKVLSIRAAGAMAVVRFAEAKDRNAAEALTGTELFVDRSVLPEPEEEDEFYHADLIGLDVHDDTGAVLGKVLAVQNFGGGDILDLMIGGRKGVLIPFTQAAVPQVAIAEGFIRVDPVAAGLVEDDNDDDRPPDHPDSEGEAGSNPSGRPRGPKDAGGNR